MKHLSLALIGAFLFMAAHAQNGGQFPENSSVKLEFAGYGKTRVYNKQSCESSIRITYGGTNWDITVPGNSSQLVNTPIPGKITAKALTNCGSTDFGLVELTITAQLLPVKFVSFKAVPKGQNRVLIQFEVAEATNVQQFNVELSIDGINWQTVTIIWPDDLQPNRTYSTIVSLNKKAN